MKIGRYVIRGFYLRLALFVLALTIACLPDILSDQADAVSTRFLVQLQPAPETITQNRDLSNYIDSGFSADCFNNFAVKPDVCRAAREKTKDFVAANWREKRRAYSVIGFNAVDNFSEWHLFIEPTKMASGLSFLEKNLIQTFAVLQIIFKKKGLTKLNLER